MMGFTRHPGGGLVAKAGANVAGLARMRLVQSLAQQLQGFKLPLRIEVTARFVHNAGRTISSSKGRNATSTSIDH
jgi:hypothetical protein